MFIVMKASEELLNEVRLVWHLILQVGERLHAQEDITLGMRAVLEHLLWEGPSTVPAIARARYVTRQHIQSLVNGLLNRNLVVLQSNPAHRRSRFVRLTAEGERLIRRMKAREAPIFAENFGVEEQGLRRAVKVLKAVRRELEQ